MKNLLKIFLSSHGRFASGIRSSCEILMGPSDNLTVFDAYLDDTSVQQHLDAFYETVGTEDQVLLCSDLYGGSVNQAMYTYLGRPNTRLVAGVNMSFMMNILAEEDGLSDERLDEILQESREYLRRVELDASAGAGEGGDDFF
ncbi:PTS sugar transporter subunit IIA [uncultured Gemmiger sp.]|uniref:PTS sugar transporter subunit IIA n=1 Tax=uncultured Gemmiger sp. TaxID=1623490 RepID=UPI0025E8AC6B|nr:PTS sugar transporter subunit IIA [uncultured Gemmiger sp.]